jgi:hypothetical protein
VSNTEVPVSRATGGSELKTSSRIVNRRHQKMLITLAIIFHVHACTFCHLTCHVPGRVSLATNVMHRSFFSTRINRFLWSVNCREGYVVWNHQRCDVVWGHLGAQSILLKLYFKTSSSGILKRDRVVYWTRLFAVNISSLGWGSWWFIPGFIGLPLRVHGGSW